MLTATELKTWTATEGMSWITANLNETKANGVKQGRAELRLNQRHRNWSLNRRKPRIGANAEFCFRFVRVNAVIVVRLWVAVSPVAATMSVIRAGFQFKFRIQRFAPGIATWLHNNQIDVAGLRREVTQRMSLQSLEDVTYQNRQSRPGVGRVR